MCLLLVAAAPLPPTEALGTFHIAATGCGVVGGRVDIVMFSTEGLEYSFADASTVQVRPGFYKIGITPERRGGNCTSSYGYSAVLPGRTRVLTMEIPEIEIVDPLTPALVAGFIPPTVESLYVRDMGNVPCDSPVSEPAVRDYSETEVNGDAYYASMFGGADETAALIFVYGGRRYAVRLPIAWSDGFIGGKFTGLRFDLTEELVGKAMAYGSDRLFCPV